LQDSTGMRMNAKGVLLRQCQTEGFYYGFITF